MMKNIRIPLLFSIILIGGLLCIDKDALAISRTNQLKKFIKAIQEKDYKKAIGFTEYVQLQVSVIKTKNPKVFWERKINEFYDSAIKQIIINQQNIDELPRFYANDKSAFSVIKLVDYFFPPQSRWEILDLRDNFIFVSVKHPDFESAPPYSSRYLKESYFKFNFSESGLFIDCKYMEEDNIFWEPQDIKQWIRNYGDVSNTSPVSLLNVETKWVKKYQSSSSLIIVPTIQFKVQNITKKPIYYMTITAVFKLKDNPNNLGDALLMTKITLLPQEISKDKFLLKSNFGVSGRTKEHILNHPNWKNASVKLFIKKYESFIPLGKFEVNKRIEDL